MEIQVFTAETFVTAIPTTREGLEATGYALIARARCRYCPATIEWRATPNGSRMPFEEVKTGEMLTHWGRCPGTQQAKKDAAKDPPKLSKKQEKAAKKRQHQSSNLFEI